MYISKWKKLNEYRKTQQVTAVGSNGVNCIECQGPTAESPENEIKQCNVKHPGIQKA